MRNVKSLFIAAALFLGISAGVQAQSKVAHIASQELITQMPAYKNAMSELERLQKTYDAEFKNMMTELQKTMERYNAEAAQKTQEENEKRAIEVQSTEKTISEYRSNAVKELQKKEIDLLKPVMENARKAVQEVARAKGFEFVLDSNPGAGVIMADGYDLMNDVKAKLGIQ